jgi:hypothetical protein
MGREIRRVPPNWRHPKRNPDRNPYRHTGLQPMYDCTFERRFAEWLEDFDRIRAGDLTDIQREVYPRGLADWLCDEGQPIDPDYYRPWKDEEATWFQLWETVSEGTPVSPPFATKEELADHLAEHGDGGWGASRPGGWGKERAYAFVMGDGWAPSMVLVGGQMMSGVEFVTTQPKGAA